MAADASILIVEDEHALHEGLADLLTVMNYRCLYADNGSAALRLLDDENIHLLLCDVNLMGEDGVSLVRRIRDTRPEIFTNLMVVMMTDHTELIETTRDNMDHHCDTFLLKPVAIRDLRLLLAGLEPGRSPHAG